MELGVTPFPLPHIPGLSCSTFLVLEEEEAAGQDVTPLAAYPEGCSPLSPKHPCRGAGDTMRGGSLCSRGLHLSRL